MSDKRWWLISDEDRKAVEAWFNDSLTDSDTMNSAEVDWYEKGRHAFSTALHTTEAVPVDFAVPPGEAEWVRLSKADVAAIKSALLAGYAGSNRPSDRSEIAAALQALEERPVPTLPPAREPGPQGFTITLTGHMAALVVDMAEDRGVIAANVLEADAGGWGRMWTVRPETDGHWQHGQGSAAYVTMAGSDRKAASYKDDQTAMLGAIRDAGHSVSVAWANFIRSTRTRLRGEGKEVY